VIKSRRMGWAEQVVPVGERRNSYRDLVGISEENRLLGRPRLRWEDNIKMIKKRNWMGSWTGLILLRTGTSGRVFMDMV
jgi:hypothetical protein